MNQLNTTQAADRLGITRIRVAELCKAGTLKAEKFGRDWLIKSTELEKFAALDRKAGRPRKEQAK